MCLKREHREMNVCRFNTNVLVYLCTNFQTFCMTRSPFRHDSIPIIIMRVSAGAAGTKKVMLLHARRAACGTQSRRRACMRTSRRCNMNPNKIVDELRSWGFRSLPDRVGIPHCRVTVFVGPGCWDEQFDKNESVNAVVSHT